MKKLNKSTELESHATLKQQVQQLRRSMEDMQHTQQHAEQQLAETVSAKQV